MNNKYFAIVITILGLIMLGVFTAWLLVNRGYVKLDSINLGGISATTTINSIFPTGDNSDNSDGGGLATGISGSATSSILFSGNQLDKQLAKLNTSPIGALISVGKNTPSILFFERATGHLFQAPPVTSPFRIANTTMPKIIAVWGGTVGSTTNFIIRTNNNQPETKLASLTTPTTTASSSVSSLFLSTEEEVGDTPQSLVIKPSPATTFNFAVSPLENQIAYLEHSPVGTNLIINNWDNTKRELAASVPLIQTNISWPASTTIAISTKASYAADGLLYLYDLRTKKLDKIMSGVKGLVAKVSPDARYVLYSGSSNESLFSALYDRRTGKIDRLPFKTLAEKCVWSRGSDLIYCGAPVNVPDGNYPDNWYQGSISFADNLWELEVSTKKATLLFNPKLNNLGETIDATQLTLDEPNQQLYFVNKNDFSLWRLMLATGF